MSLTNATPNKQAEINNQATILCVDDEANVLSALRRLLRKNGYQLLFAENGLEALNILEKQPVDLIISDMRMPEMDGAKLLSHVAQRWPSTMRILLTGYADIASTIEAINQGNIYKYIKKPWDDNDLMLSIKHALELKFAESERLRLEALTREQNEQLHILNDHLSERTLHVEQREARLGRILNSSQNEIYIFDAETLHFIEVNEGARNNLGYTLDELSKLTPVDIKPDFSEDEFLNFVQPLFKKQQKQLIFETVHQRKDNSTYPVEVRLQLSHTEQTPVFFAIIQDITERKNNEQQIRYLAYYDSLTDLPNRRFFMEMLTDSLSQAKRYSKNIAVLYIDLDRFKQINDSLGHSIGDGLLKGVAERLNTEMRNSDYVSRNESMNSSNDFCRLGGDEFTVLLSDISQAEDAALVARRIQDALTKPIMIEGREIFINTSIGIAVYPNDGDDIDNLLKNADTAMYDAKKAGRNTYRFYNDSMNAKALENLEMEIELRKAFELNQLEIYFQPKVDSKNSNICGVEALLRWQHEKDDWISPADFIPIAEENGLIVPIGEWVIDSAIGQCKKWHDAGFVQMSVAINLSSRQFQDGDLADLIENLLNKHQVNPNSIEFEITESILMEDAELATKILGRLKKMGVQISIDDFGTGYSSLSYLKRFPVDIIKIDRSFIRDVHIDFDDAAISSAIIAMAHSLGLKVIAEGVENQQQLNFLRERNCDQIQGFYFSQALPIEELTLLLADPTAFKK